MTAISLLPHVLTVVMAYAYVKYAAAAPLTQFASLLGYHAYLKMRYLLLMDHGAPGAYRRAHARYSAVCAAAFR